MSYQNHSAIAAGIRYGDFELIKKVGAGGMGLVFLAEQKGVGRKVAVKFLGSLTNSAEGLLRFQREARAIAALQHPGIATLYFVGEDRGVAFMAMEYVEGRSLMELMEGLRINNSADSLESVLVSTLAEEKDCVIDYLTEPFVGRVNENDKSFPLTRHAAQLVKSQSYIKRCCEVVGDCAQALAHAHSRQVIHRDIKPSNIMLDMTGKIRIIDFGLARYVDGLTITRTGVLLGTPLYMSPEQVAARAEVDFRTDIYSLGLVLFELLVLAPAICASSREAVFNRIVGKQLTPVSWLNPAVSASLQAVVHKATNKDPDLRYKSMEEFAADLDAAASGKAVIAPSYRYQTDVREVMAQRPAVVDAFRLVLFLVGAFVLVPSIVISIGGGGPFSPPTVFMAMPFLLLLIVGIQLSRGYAWAGLTAMLLGYVGAAGMIGLAIKAFPSYATVYFGALSIPIAWAATLLMSKKQRKWYALVRSCRGEGSSQERSLAIDSRVAEG